MDTTRVTSNRRIPYWTWVAIVVVVVLLVVVARQFWIATPPNTLVDDSAPTALRELPSDTPIRDRLFADDSSATEFIFASSGDDSLTVSIAPQLLEDSPEDVGAPAPYFDESMADEYAIGVVEKVVQRGNASYLPLKLNEVFIGRLPIGRFLAKDKMVVLIECSLPPKNLGLRSQLYQPGSKVVVYLARDDANRWTVTSLIPITPGLEQYWRHRLQTFADVVLVGESEDPENRLRELLVLQPSGGFEDTLYHAIMIHPHPAARPIVREFWRQRVKQFPVDPEESEMVGGMSLTYLMQSLNEGEMLDEILEHAMRQKPGQRAIYIDRLRVLADYADADSRNRLKAGLQKFLADSPALDTLDRVKDIQLWSDVANTQQALQYLEYLDSKS